MEKLTLKKILTPQPVTRVERTMTSFYIFIFFLLTIVPDLVFGFDTITILQKFFFLVSFFSLYIGYKVGRNHDRIDAWMSRMKHKFSKKSNDLPEINNNF